MGSVLLISIFAPSLSVASADAAADASIDGSAPFETQTRKISDSLVENLDCKSLTAANVLTYVSKEKLRKKYTEIGAVSSNFVIPGMDGHCWAVAKAQRKALLLLLGGVEAAAKPMAELSDDYLDAVRGTRFDKVCWNQDQTIRDSGCYEAAKKEPKIDLQVIPIANSSGTVSEVLRFSRGGSPSVRTLESELRRSQHNLFYRPSNLKYLGGADVRSVDDTKAVVSRIVQQMTAGQLPILNLRVRRTYQHMVVAQEMRLMGHGAVEIKVFDSNDAMEAWTDGRELQTLIYADGEFRYFGKKSDRGKGTVVGVFVTDNDEMDEIQNAVFKYYHARCSE